MSRALKDTIYEQFARIGHAVSSPKRLELVDLLAQGEKTVEQLAEQSSTPVKNTSAHLRVLRQARLVETRRDGSYVLYRLADDGAVLLLRQIGALARARLAEVAQVADLYITRRDALEPVSLPELRKRLRDGDVTLLDVRPEDEYAAGHIPGAISIPVAQLKRRLAELPRNREIIAYCRGPYCVYSVEAVDLLRKHHYQARRADEGLPDWRARGYPIAHAQSAS
jgi:rhodanese-related sulfurtransferase/DNA-binding MarR family transcriptional regulator